MSEEARWSEVLEADAERCLTCRLRFTRQAAADAHYALTGHMMGWPLDANSGDWPVRDHESR
jgi:hypothetical protein